MRRRKITQAGSWSGISPTSGFPAERLRRIAVALTFAACVTAGSTCIAAGSRSHVTVVGSSTVFPFASVVAETFGKKGRWRTPTVESIGTGAGFKLFCSGTGIDTPDINTASRPITDSERALCERNEVYGVLGLQIGFEGIVIASNKRTPAFDLTSEQLYRAIAKTVAVNGHLIANPYRRWVDVDPALPNRPISILGPAPNHGTRDAFTALLLVPPCQRTPAIRSLPQVEQTQACQAVREDGAWTDIPGDYGLLLGKLRNDPNALAILPFSYLDQNRDAIRAARIDGIAPSPQTIHQFQYRGARPLFIYVKTSHLSAVTGLGDFILEFLSVRAAGADGYLVEKGLVPLPAAWLDGERRKLTDRMPPPARSR